MVNVEKEQKHVGELAKRDPTHRFTGLYRKLGEEAWLIAAWQRIRRNKGSRTPGVDGQTRDEVDPPLIRRLADRLRKEEYQPTPVRRVYIPKANGKLRPLGIPTIQDRIVQSALKMVLEPIYEQDFRPCSHGFRPTRSCITALRNVALRFPRCTWIIEGDITGCYDTIPHGRLLALLRRRIGDEKLLRLIHRFLQAGYLEQWHYHRTYSGTPQGGILSPLLANIYLQELDTFMEETLGTNPPRESSQAKSARRTKESRRLSNRRARLRSWLKTGQKWHHWNKRNAGLPLTADMRRQIGEELKELTKAQRQIPSLEPRRLRGYVRYADDYLVILQRHCRAEAESVKESVRAYLQTYLQLEQNAEKTRITHPTERVTFLGYHLKSHGGRRKGLRLEIPRAAKDTLLTEVERLCRLHHIADADLFLKVNAVIRGWMNYYRYATAPQRTFTALLARVFWQVCHYLAARHRTSIPTILRRYSTTVRKNGRTRKTLRIWVRGKAIDLWLFPPKTQSIHSTVTGSTGIEEKPRLLHEWATGRSIEKRIEALEAAHYQCQACGTVTALEVHHVGGLRGYRGTKNQAAAGQAKERVVLCRSCHLESGHGGSFKPRN